MALATGRSASTFTRLGYGHSISADALAACMVWLGDTDIRRYLVHTPE